MAKFSVWLEKQESGSILVRHRNTDGSRETDYCVAETDRATVNGEELVGKSLAKAYANLVRDRFRNGELGASDLKAEIQPLIVEFLDDLEGEEMAAGYVDHCRVALRHFVNDVRIGRVGDITKIKIKAFRRIMQRRKWSKNTVRNYLSDVRRFCSWLVENGHVVKTPFAKGIMPAKKAPEPRYWTEEEVQKFDVEIAKISTPTRLLCLLAHDLGLRRDECLHVLWEDITWFPDGRASLHIRKEISKGQLKSRSAILTSRLIEALGSRRSGRIVTVSKNHVDHCFQKARERAQLAGKPTIHGLRHTFAKNWLQRGKGDLRSLQEALGHKSIQTTEIYSQFEKSYFHEIAERMDEGNRREAALANKSLGLTRPPVAVTGLTLGQISVSGERTGSDSNGLGHLTGGTNGR